MNRAYRSMSRGEVHSAGAFRQGGWGAGDFPEHRLGAAPCKSARGNASFPPTSGSFRLSPLATEFGEVFVERQNFHPAIPGSRREEAVRDVTGRTGKSAQRILQHPLPAIPNAGNLREGGQLARDLMSRNLKPLFKDPHRLDHYAVFQFTPLYPFLQPPDESRGTRRLFRIIAEQKPEDDVCVEE